MAKSLGLAALVEQASANVEHNISAYCKSKNERKSELNLGAKNLTVNGIFDAAENPGTVLRQSCKQHLYLT